MNVLIAGGTGLIGKELTKLLLANGHQVKVLSRSGRDDTVFWNPDKQEINSEDISDTEVIINLCGAGIADKRWTKSRKNELINSRINPANFLFGLRSKMPNLKQYISASGISAYGFEDKDTPFVESDAYGADFTSQLVKQWEEAADQFQDSCLVTKLRIAIVLSSEGGAVQKMSAPIKKGFGASIASGNQKMQWIHIDDLTKLMMYAFTNNLNGTYNAMTDQCTNKEFTLALAGILNKRIWLPNVPGFVMRILFGEMADILINGVGVSNEKLLESGFTSKHTNLSDALNALNTRKLQ